MRSDWTLVSVILSYWKPFRQRLARSRASSWPQPLGLKKQWSWRLRNSAVSRPRLMSARGEQRQNEPTPKRVDKPDFANVLIWSSAAGAAHWHREGNDLKVTFSSGQATFMMRDRTSKEDETRWSTRSTRQSKPLRPPAPRRPTRSELSVTATQLQLDELAAFGLHASID